MCLMVIYGYFAGNLLFVKVSFIAIYSFSYEFNITVFTYNSLMLFVCQVILIIIYSCTRYIFIFTLMVIKIGLTAFKVHLIVNCGFTDQIILS